MRIVYFGSSSFGIPSLRALKDSQHDLVGIFTQPARPFGRHKTPRPTAVAEWARDNSIPCSEAEDVNTSDNRDAVAAYGADLLVVIAFGQKISADVIELHPKGAINVHASLLPKYRGAAPVNWAIMEGEAETGVSIITLADRMDAGFVLGRTAMDIDAEDTAESLHDKLAELSVPILLQTIQRIAEGTAVYETQDESLVTFAPKLSKSHGCLDFSEPAERIVDKVRGLWPWPGGQADYVCAQTSKCCRVTIARARVVPSTTDGPSGYGLLDSDLNVVCGRDRLQILRIKPAGGSLMDFADFINGRATRPGDLFMTIENK